VQKLIKKAQKGDKESFGLLIANVQDKAYRVAYGYLKNPEDSMDAVCDSVEIAYKKLGQLKKAEFFETWFIRIVINQCNMHLRKREKIKTMVHQLECLEDMGKVSEESGSDGKEETLKIMEEKLLHMNEIDRNILHMKYWTGAKIREIAEMLKMPEGSVKTRLYGSLKKLKREISLEVDNDEGR